MKDDRTALAQNLLLVPLLGSNLMLHEKCQPPQGNLRCELRGDPRRGRTAWHLVGVIFRIDRWRESSGSRTMTSVVQDLLLVLCLLLRKACGDFVAEDLHVVDGLINQYITLPCSFPIPDNWKGQDIHITWYKNFTDKLLDCMVRDGKTPVCQKYPDSSRIQLSWKFLGNADLDIYRFQESDEGPYQCWVIFDDAYQRQDTLLRFHGDLAGRRDASLFDGFVGWHSILVVSTWNVLLLSGWPFSLLLAWIFLSQRCHNRRKGKRINI